MILEKNADQLLCNSIEELSFIAEQLVQFGNGVKVWLFWGEMGAGKTTLIKKICAHLGVYDNVNSPTFSLVNEYETKAGETVYHFDFYRIKNEREALDIGVEEYLDSGNLCLVEWPDKITSILPEHYLEISIEEKENLQRQIRLLRK